MSKQDTIQKKCVHHWIIEAPEGRTSFGKCRFCGMVKEFFNDLSDPFLLDNAASSGDKFENTPDTSKHPSYPFT